MTIALEMLFRELQEAHSFDEKFCLPVLARVGVATSLGRTGLPHRRLPKLFKCFLPLFYLYFSPGLGTGAAAFGTDLSWGFSSGEQAVDEVGHRRNCLVLPE